MRSLTTKSFAANKPIYGVANSMYENDFAIPASRSNAAAEASNA